MDLLIACIFCIPMVCLMVYGIIAAFKFFVSVIVLQNYKRFSNEMKEVNSGLSLIPLIALLVSGAIICFLLGPIGWIIAILAILLLICCC